MLNELKEAEDDPLRILGLRTRSMFCSSLWMGTHDHICARKHRQIFLDLRPCRFCFNLDQFRCISQARKVSKLGNYIFRVHGHFLREQGFFDSEHRSVGSKVLLKF